MMPNDHAGDNQPEDEAGSDQLDPQPTPESTQKSSGNNGHGSADDQRPGRGFGMMPLLIIGSLLAVAWFMYDLPSNHGTGVPHNFFRQQLLAGNVKSLTVYHMENGDVFTGEWKTILAE